MMEALMILLKVLGACVAMLVPVTTFVLFAIRIKKP